MELLREEKRQTQQDLFRDLREVQDVLVSEEDQLTTVREAIERLNLRKTMKLKEHSELVEKRSTLEVEIQETFAVSKASIVERNELTAQFDEVAAAITQTKQQLASMQPDYERRSQNCRELQQQHNDVSAAIDTLYGKQGRGKQFSNKKERDAFLQSQITQLQQQVSTKNDLLEQTRAEIDEQQQQQAANANTIKQMEKEKQQLSKRANDIKQQLQTKTQQRNELLDNRKTNWKELEVVNEKIQEAKVELGRGKDQLNRPLPRHMTQGLLAVEVIAQEKNIAGYYGPLIDNFNLRNGAFKTAVEVAAGNNLFHVIVDTDTTAAMFIKELDRRKAGRLTFLPLNRLNKDGHSIRYPDSNDVRPLLEVAIEFEPLFEPAMRQVSCLLLIVLGVRCLLVLILFGIFDDSC